MGCLWSLDLRLGPVVDLVENPCDLFDFLLQRQDSKPTVLLALRRLIGSLSPAADGSPRRTVSDLTVLGRIFDRLNECYRNLLDIEIQSQIAQPASSPLQLQSRTSPVLIRPTVVVDQVMSVGNSKSEMLLIRLSVPNRTTCTLEFYHT